MERDAEEATAHRTSRKALPQQSTIQDPVTIKKNSSARHEMAYSHFVCCAFQLGMGDYKMPDCSLRYFRMRCDVVWIHRRHKTWCPRSRHRCPEGAVTRRIHAAEAACGTLIPHLAAFRT
jgi:hypothetical protein